MNKGLKKAVVCALSAGLMLASLAGCSKKEEEVKATLDTTKAVATVGDASITTGVLNVAVRYTQASVEALYMNYFGLEDPFNMDLYGSGNTLGDDAKSDAVNLLGESLLAEQHMEEYGVELTDVEKAQIALYSEEFMAENDPAVLEAVGIDKESVERYMELYIIRNKVQTAMCVDVDTVVTDEEAAQRTIKYVFFTAAAEETAEAETENESEAPVAVETEVEAESETEGESESPYMAAAYGHALGMIAELKDGGDFDELAEKYGKTPNELSFGADYSVTQLVDATEGLEDGAIVEVPVRSNGESYYVAQVVSAFDAEATENKKEDIVKTRKNTVISEIYDSWNIDTPVELDPEALALITFDKFYLQPVQEEVETEATTEAMTE